MFLRVKPVDLRAYRATRSSTCIRLERMSTPTRASILYTDFTVFGFASTRIYVAGVPLRRSSAPNRSAVCACTWRAYRPPRCGRPDDSAPAMS